jgi:rhodanese-related sulfurtransferase
LKNNSLSKYIILLQLVLLIIFALITSGCAGTNQNSTFTAPQPATGENTTLTAPQPERNKISKFISPQEAFTLIQKNQNNPYFVIIDDRPPAQFMASHIAGAIDIPFANYRKGVSSLDKNRIYLVYCWTGCGQSSSIMKDLGFKEVYEIRGGLDAWVSEGLPLVKSSVPQP